jgi:hypothetical protein
MHWKYALYSSGAMQGAAKAILSGIRDLKPRVRVTEFESARRIAPVSSLKGIGSHHIANQGAGRLLPGFDALKPLLLIAVHHRADNRLCPANPAADNDEKSHRQSR